MTRLAKIASVVTTAGLLAGAVALGGGTPLSPAALARQTRRAAANVATAAHNTERAVATTEALASIARNVASQVATSERLLRIQLDIEASSARGAARSKRLQDALGRMRDRLRGFAARLGGLSALAERSGGAARSSAAAAARLDGALRALMRRFDTVVAESRELDRKARGYGRLRGLLP